ncbi:hypothetical protein [Amycolatopsis anabasis]|uniref:hypothetical protein n=1 Tax=Amycolatopsis anabasis TaxID=1840409 RepID=UPI00131C85CB|nr:hypothetical protein [Amycolatopsis anabasis]
MRHKAVLLVLAVLGALLSPAPATAAATFPRLDAATVDSFRWTAGDTFKNYGERVAGLESHAQLAPRGLGEVLASANRAARPLCHGTHLDAALKPAGFCWEDGNDDKTNAWIPQGLTGSGDADPATGKVGGKRVVSASWHTPGDTMVRLSFADVTDPAKMRYRHALLVEPTSNDDFAVVPGHGHGMTWIGDLLFVATTGGLIRVFDTRHFWKVDDSSGEIGLGKDGKYHAAYYDYALPQVGAYWYPGGGACTSVTGARPCLATLAFDHTGDGSLLTAEHVPGAAKGRIVRWPLDPATGRPKEQADKQVHAGEGFVSPVWGMQGAIAKDGYFVLTGVCPEFAGQPGDHPSCLHGGVGGVSTSRLGRAPVNSQNLSYWPATGELWLLNEQLRERVTVHVPWKTLTGRA